jgi:hypothetical protein
MFKTIEQPDRQQDIAAARGDVSQSRHLEVCWEGLLMFSKQKHTKGYAIVPPRSHILWVCLLKKCEILNRYCRAMTRFGIKPCRLILNSSFAHKERI